MNNNPEELKTEVMEILEKIKNIDFEKFNEEQLKSVSEKMIEIRKELK